MQTAESSGAKTNEPSLIQRRGARKWTYRLEEDAVDVLDVHLIRRTKYRVRYVTLTGETFETTEYSGGWLGTTVIASVILVVGLIVKLTDGDDGWAGLVAWAVLTTLAGALFWNSWYRVCGFYGSGPALSFIVNNPTRSDYEGFLAELESYRIGHLRRHYLMRSERESVADELQKLAWLKENGAITEGEFERLKQQVIGDGEGPLTPPEYVH